MAERDVRLPSPLIQAVEDAVLFGNIKEIDMLLDMVRDDVRFPAKLRSDLEALMYFRQFYGKGGILEQIAPEDRQAARRLEDMWGRELIESIGHAPDLEDTRFALRA